MGYVLSPSLDHWFVKLTILAVSLEGSAISSIPRDLVATYKNIMSMAGQSVCMRRMAGSTMPGSVGHIHIRWMRCVALEELRRDPTNLTKSPERTKPIRHVVSLDTWYHP